MVTIPNTHALYVGAAVHLKRQEEQRRQLQQLVELGLTLSTIARLAGKSQKTVERILRGDWRVA